VSDPVLARVDTLGPCQMIPHRRSGALGRAVGDRLEDRAVPMLRVRDSGPTGGHADGTGEDQDVAHLVDQLQEQSVVRGAQNGVVERGVVVRIRLRVLHRLAQRIELPA
jgi:hypothetical protein